MLPNFRPQAILWRWKTRRQRKTHLGANEQKKEIPRSWYAEIDRALHDLRRECILEYADADVVALQGLLRKLLSSLGRAGIKPHRLSSCAGLSRLKYGKKLADVRPPDYLNRLFRQSFFGGRIETRSLGACGRTRLYDLHSAYPSVLASLISPRGRQYTLRPGENPSLGADYGTYEIRADVPLDWLWGPLAVRHGGRVIYPVGRVQTFCGVSALRALRAHRVKFEVLSGTEIYQSDKSPLFPDIEALYLQRKDPDLSLAIKTILNSTYGLTAETTEKYVETEILSGNARYAGNYLVSRHSSFGRLTNFILASAITEETRIRVWEQMHRLGDKCLFAATDGLLVDARAELPTSDKLGEWGLKGEYENGVILGCGRYYLGPDNCHLRGFPFDNSTFEKLRNTRRKYAMLPALETDSLKQWAQNIGADLNVLLNTRRRLEINDDKRHWLGKIPRICDAWDMQINSLPWIIN